MLVIAGAVLMVVSGGAIAVEQALFAWVNGSVNQEDLLGNEDGGNINGALNILMVGLDERADNPDLGIRADSIIILHIPASHDQAFLLSIPRDSFVDIPPYAPARFGGAREKINGAFYYGSQNGGGRKGGFTLLAQTIRRLVPNIRFNGGAIINFDGFKAMVDALGGIKMCVDEKVTSVHIGTDSKGKYARPFMIGDDGRVQYPIRGVTPKVYPVGCYDMQGWEALDFCRQRDLLDDGDGDYGRQRHQQQFVKAVVKKAVSEGLTNPTKVAKIMSAAGQALTFDGGNAKLEDWIYTLKGINPDALVMLKMNAGKYNSETLPDGASIENLSPLSLELLAAARDDTVGQFAAKHADWVSRDS